MKRLILGFNISLSGEILMKTAISIALAIVFVLSPSLHASQQPQQSRTKLLTVLALIDGSDVLKIRGNELWFEHRNFELPGKWVDHFDASGNEPTYINSEAWAPKWNGDVSLPFAAKARLLPEASQFDVRLVTPLDRGSVTVLQQPSAQNDFTLSILLDDDLPNGAAWYQVELRLK
jgi:hypothetical protein